MNAPARKMLVDLDAYYAARPAPRPLFTYPVYRDYFCSTRPVAVFDTWGEAADFAMQHDLFMGDAKRRAA